MTFIGIVSEQKSDIELERAIAGNLLTKSNIIHIHVDNIENMKNVKFETILVIETKTILSKADVLKKMISNTQYLIINSDIKSNLLLLDKLNLNVITFGFNNKSTITASSVNEENVLVCVQRNIRGKDNNIIEPQEIKISRKNSHNIYKIMGIIGVILVYNHEKMEKNIKI